MKKCKLTYLCKATLKLLLTILISVSFVLAAIAFEHRIPTTNTAVSAQSSAAKKSFLVMIADAEEEVESSENNQDENFDGDAAGVFLFCGSYVRYKTALPVFCTSTFASIGGRPVLKLPLYLLFNRLKVFSLLNF